MSDETRYPYFFAIGFRSLFRIIGKRKIFSSSLFHISFLISAIVSCTFIFVDSDCRDFLSFISDIIVGMFPNLLGFALAGYAIVIGSGSQHVFDETAKKEPNEKFSLYQTTNSVWGFILLANVAALLIGFATKISAKFFEEINLTTSYIFSKSINISLIFTLILIAFYAILLHVRMVELVFNYGQKHLLFSLGTSLTEEERETAIREAKPINWKFWKQKK